MHYKILKIIISIVNKVYLMKTSAEITKIDITMMTKVSAHGNTSGWNNWHLVV